MGRRSDVVCELELAGRRRFRGQLACQDMVGEKPRVSMRVDAVAKESGKNRAFVLVSVMVTARACTNDCVVVFSLVDRLIRALVDFHF